MNRPSREAIFAALFAQLETLPGLVTCSRRLKNAQEIQPEGFPAAFQIQDAQALAYKGTLPTNNTWKVSWLIYTYSTDPTVAPSTALNNLVDAATEILAPSPGQPANTLGGLVTHVGLDGNIQIFEGVLGDRAIAILPISIVLPGF